MKTNSLLAMTSLVLILFLSDCLLAQRPNVLVIMTDDQGYGEFSCNGNPFVETPNIDALAQQSVRLTDFHVAPMCTPTRGQLMTGLDAFRNGASNVSSGRTLMRPELKTMANVFKDAGYRTGLFGKWHLGDNYPFRPSDRGFDESIWFPSSHINSVPDHWDNDYFDDTYIHNGQRKQFKGYCTDVFFEEAIQWMKAAGTDADAESDDDASAKQDEPFFGYIALNSAHWPWFVPDQYRGPVQEKLLENKSQLGAILENKARMKSLVSFLAMGANIDDNVGKLDAALKDAGLFENTIVVFLTDNGSTFGADYYNAGMKGKKTQLWEGGHRVPCFIRWPGGELEVREISELSQVQDLLPTLAALAGDQVVRQLPKKLDGVSLKPVLTGEVETIGDRKLVINYSRMPGFKATYTDGNPAIPQRDGAAVLWKNWRLLENRMLFDVAADPSQQNDVASEYPEVVAELQEHLQSWWDEVKDEVTTPQRVVIGHESENPMMLTACEWLDVFVDQQRQIRNAAKKNGVWHLSVDQAGTYKIELRRWPRESGFAVNAGCEKTKVTDGLYPKGIQLPIQNARLEIRNGAGILFKGKSESGGANESFVFQMELPAGEIEMQSWMNDENGDSICGAYYAYVTRVE
ncbi:MAG: arylsulfatase [Planctomycetota bacterium]